MKRILLLCIWFISSAASAADCVKIRDTCMTFSDQELHAAEAQGLILGMPYADVRNRLLAQGWVESADGEKIACGSGIDATCSAIYRNANQTLTLMFSAVNNGFPLVAVMSGAD